MNENRLIYLYIYRHYENGKAYIGVTRDPVRRFKKHAKGNSSSIAFNRAVKKYGIESFKFDILAIFDDVNAANYHENAAIKAYGTLSPMGYNLIDGAPKSKYFGSMSQETKDRIAAANRGRMPSVESREKSSQRLKGKPSLFKGKTFTSESRRKLSEAHKGIPLSPEHRKSIIESRTPEVIAKITSKLKGRKLTSEHRAAISSGGLGKHHRPHSEETRMKLSEIAKKQWEDPEFRRKYSAIRTGKKLKKRISSSPSETVNNV